ncbi:MAG: substrate-binding domain-containing protein [Candidatus Dormibacteraceae bacterium]
MSAYTTPALTTIRQPTYEMGRRAAELLIDSIHAGVAARPATILFEPELIVRESTAKVTTLRRSRANG